MPSCAARAARFRISTCNQTTGSQQHPINTYKAMDQRNHGMESGYPASRTIAKPVAGCNTTALAVKIASAMTTSRATAAITRTSPVLCARTKKKAIPAPIPNNTVEDTTCAHFSQR
jgi:hypothetical protein